MRYIFDKTNSRSTWQVVAVVCLLIASPILSQTGGQYELNWSTIDSGGGTSSGGQYIVSGTIGQADAGVMSGGSYEY